MELPLADEIRALRRRAEEATAASLQLLNIRAILPALDAIEPQLARNPEPGIGLPGDQEVETMADRWPALADLRAAMPGPAAPYLARLQARRMQFETARRVLAPLAEEQGEVARRLHALQLEQRAALAAPRYAADVADLVSIGTERERLARNLKPVSELLPRMEAAVRILGVFEDRLRGALTEARTSDPSGMHAFRAAHLGCGLVEGLSASLDQLDLGLRIPAIPDPPPVPSPDGHEEIASGLGVAVEAVAAMHADMTRDSERVRRDVADLTTAYDRLTREILERMG